MSLPLHAAPAHRARPAAPIWVAALAAVVLLSGIEVRQAAAGETLSPRSSFGRHSESYFLGACHPFQSPHAETAKEAWRPLCALCLNRLHGMGADPGKGRRLWICRDGRPLPMAPAGSPLRRSRNADASRAPPLA